MAMETWHHHARILRQDIRRDVWRTTSLKMLSCISGQCHPFLPALAGATALRGGCRKKLNVHAQYHRHTPMYINTDAEVIALDVL